jgi:hypothetical protein
MMKTLESVIAVSIITVIAASMFSNIPVSGASLADEVKKGYSALQYLDYTGELRPAVDSADLGALHDMLIPLIGNFEIELCSNACAGTARQNAAAVDYFISGYRNFGVKRVRLYVW